MNLFSVRHNSTGHLLPIMKGASWWEGEEGKVPRFFASRRAAYAFIVSWAKGRYTPHYVEGNDPWSDGHSELRIEDQGRKRTHCSIVEFFLTEVPL